ALALQLVLLEGRMLQDVSDDIDGERRILGKHLGVIGGLLARRIGVEMAAHLFDGLGDLAGAAPLGALEGHVLEQMRDAVDLGPLVARADIDPNAERHRVDAGHEVARDLEPVLELGDLDAHAAPARRGARSSRSLMKRCTAAASLGSTVKRSWRSNRSPSSGGSGAERPMARVTASGNLAGWAQASATIGVFSSPRRSFAAATATALCGSMISPLSFQLRAIAARVAGSSMETASNSRRASS